MAKRGGKAGFVYIDGQPKRPEWILIDGEEWRAIPGHEGRYEVSSLGRVRSVARLSTAGGRTYGGQVLGQRRNRFGYPTVGISGGGTHRVHRLVLLAFVGAAPEGMEVRHLNGDQMDNRLENLCYGTKLENARDRHAHGNYPSGGRHPSAKLSDEIRAHIRASYPAVSQSELARRYGVTQAAVWNVLYRKPVHG